MSDGGDMPVLGGSDRAGNAPAHGAESGSPRRDVVDGALWTALGGAILIGSWRMDRLEAQGINPYTAPGLVPGLLGLAMALFGLVMAARGARHGGLAWPPPVPDARPASYGRLAVVIGLCLAFAVGLVGHGPPFWLAAALFVSTTIFVLRFREFREKNQIGRGLAMALAVGIGAGVIVTVVFEKFFFVRLP